jgi:Cdc6-like AAA superfamily ATPase
LPIDSGGIGIEGEKGRGRTAAMKMAMERFMEERRGEEKIRCSGHRTRGS